MVCNKSNNDYIDSTLFIKINNASFKEKYKKEDFR